MGAGCHMRWAQCPVKVRFFIITLNFRLNLYLVGGFTLSGLRPGQAVDTVSSISPPGTCLYFLSRIGFSICSSFSSNVDNSRFRAFRYTIFMQEKVLTSMHSVRLEPMKLILVGTRTTYEATGETMSMIFFTPWISDV